MKINEISEVILKHFNHDINTAKVLNAIINAIKLGRETDLKFEAEREADRLLLQTQWEWLNEFWNKHRLEFLEQGFIENPYTSHPLFGAYNEISCKMSYLKMEKAQNPFVITSHRFKDFEATGPMSMNEIADRTGLNIKDIKTSINKLESLNIVGKGKKDFISTYWYWLEDDTYLI